MFSNSIRNGAGGVFLPFIAGVTFGGVIANYRKENPDLELVAAYPSDNLKDKERVSLYKYGRPEPSVSIHQYKSHSLAYDRSRKIPVWVMEVLSRADEANTADRKKSNFKPDPAISKIFSSNNSDYWKSGWSRGHMAAAGNYKHCQESMDDTFYLTNIVPQNFENNENYWYRVENYCRQLTKRYDEVRIISGPLFLPNDGTKDTKKFVNYRVIGEGDVSVPTHLYKIIVAENSNGRDPPLLGSFVIPNEPVEDQLLQSFKRPIEDIEKWTGTHFLEYLQRHKCLDLCDKDGCQIMSMKEYMKIHYTRRIPSAKDRSRLDTLWTEMKTKGIEPDSELTEAYKKRLNELENNN